MDEFRSMVRIETKDYGKVKLNLAKLLDEKGLTRNGLSTLTGIKYAVIDRYYKAESVERVDLDILAKVCYSTNCKIEDLLIYQEPEEK